MKLYRINLLKLTMESKKSFQYFTFVGTSTWISKSRGDMSEGKMRHVSYDYIVRKVFHDFSYPFSPFLCLRLFPRLLYLPLIYLYMHRLRLLDHPFLLLRLRFIFSLMLPLFASLSCHSLSYTAPRADLTFPTFPRHTYLTEKK